MNIFATSKDPERAAIALQQKHAKMILESAQLLSTAHVILDGKKVGYGATHKNHPSAIWVRDSPENYRWLVEHTLAATAEFKYRNGHEHGSGILVKEKLRKPPSNYSGEYDGLTPVRLAIADYLKINKGETWSEVIKAYRYYYSVDKLVFLSDSGKLTLNSWVKRKPPEWFVEFWSGKGLQLVEVEPQVYSVTV